MRKLEETLRKSEMAIKDLDYEAAHIIDTDGNLIHVESGRRHSVSPPPELVKGNILTHNHPSGGCAFGLDDIRTAIKLDAYEIRTVTSDGRFVSFKKGSKILDVTIVEDMKNAGLNTVNLMLSAEKKVIKLYGRKYERRCLVREIERTMNDWLRSNAAKYGYIFTEGEI